jgi:hypothetical protein
MQLFFQQSDNCGFEMGKHVVRERGNVDKIFEPSK